MVFIPTDEAFGKLDQLGIISKTESWYEQGIYHFPSMGKKVYEIMKNYILNS
jgi:hypothetical protein